MTCQDHAIRSENMIRVREKFFTKYKSFYRKALKLFNRQAQGNICYEETIDFIS